MAHELYGWQRYLIVGAGMLLAGAVCSLAIPFTVAPRGTIGPTLLQAQSVVSAVTATVLCFAAATGIAGIVGRYVNAVVGLFVLGAGLSVLRLRSGTIQDLAFAEGGLGLLALETALWGILVLAATLVVFKMAGPLTDIVATDDGVDPPPLWSRLGLRGVGAGLLVLPVAWLIARSQLRSQTLMAIVVGAMVVGLVGRLLAPHAQPRLLFASPCFFGVLGHLLGMMMVSGALSEAFVTESISLLSFPMPIDYAAGSLMGVALGVGWAKSFLQHEEHAEAGSQQSLSGR